MTSPRLGLDRELKLSWLDEAAVIAGRDLNRSEFQSALMEALAAELPGAAHNSARGKTVTVLKRVWVTVPNDVAPLRDRALRLLLDGDAEDRLALHWAMLLVTHPFFADVAASIGRFLALQRSFERGHVVRRLQEKWGDRPTIPKAVRRVLSSIVSWQVLDRAGSQFSMSRAPIRLASEHAELLLEATVRSFPGRTAPMQALLMSPMLFPFDVAQGVEGFRRSSAVTLHREGIDVEIVSIRS